MIIHDFTMICHIRVLRVHQKINHLRAKINEIKGHHHVPREKPSEIDPLIDQNNTVLKKFKIQLGLCSWRQFLFKDFLKLIENIFNWAHVIYKPQAWLSWLWFWLVRVRAWVQVLVETKPNFLTLFFLFFFTTSPINLTNQNSLFSLHFFLHSLFNIHILTILKKSQKKIHLIYF